MRIHALLHVLQNFLPGNHSRPVGDPRFAGAVRKATGLSISTGVEIVWKLFAPPRRGFSFRIAYEFLCGTSPVPRASILRRDRPLPKTNRSPPRWALERGGDSAQLLRRGQAKNLRREKAILTAHAQFFHMRLRTGHLANLQMKSGLARTFAARYLPAAEFLYSLCGFLCARSLAQGFTPARRAAVLA